MNETKFNAMLQSVAAQRDQFANQVVHLQGELAEKSERIAELSRKLAESLEAVPRDLTEEDVRVKTDEARSGKAHLDLGHAVAANKPFHEVKMVGAG